MTSPPLVYTVLVGDHEALLEQPLAAAAGATLVCLTDRDDVRSGTWEVRRIAPVLDGDPARSSREPKIRPHLHFPDHDVSLYVDNSVRLETDPRDVVARLLPEDAPMGLCRHSFRATVHDEFAEVLRLGLDEPARVTEQWNHYALNDPDVLALRPWWGGILARRHGDPRIAAAMERWWTYVLRYSRRDQLSLRSAFRTADGPTCHVHDVELDNRTGDGRWTWPASQGRDPASYRAAATDAVVPTPLQAAMARAEAAELRARLAATEQQHLELVREHADLVEADRRVRADATAERARLEAELRRVAAERDDAAAHLDAVLRSASWRLTGPARSVRSWPGRRRRDGGA